MPAEDLDDLLSSISLADYIAHYASKYYDPDKRREYYLRTRKLKGTNPTDGMSENQKEIWKVTKGNIAEEKSRKGKEAKTAFEAKLQELQAKPEEAKVRIAQQLADRLTKVDVDIPIPRNAPPARRRYLEAQRQKQRGLIKDRFRDEVTKLVEQFRIDTKNTREGFKADKEASDKYYEAETNSELEKIKTQAS